MADAADFLLAVYTEHMEQARWHEEQREKVSALVFAGTGALLAFGTGAGHWQQRVAYTLVAVLGLVGIVIALKHYERNRRHVQLGRCLRERLDLLLPEAGVGTAMRLQPRYDSFACRAVEPVRLYILWPLLTLFVAGLGLVLLVLSSF